MPPLVKERGGEEEEEVEEEEEGQSHSTKVREGGHQK